MTTNKDNSRLLCSLDIKYARNTYTEFVFSLKNLLVQLNASIYTPFSIRWFCYLKLAFCIFHCLILIYILYRLFSEVFNLLNNSINEQMLIV